MRFPTAARYRRPSLVFALAMLACLANVSLRAQGQDDIRRALDQRNERQAIERERELLKDELEDEARPTLTIDGQTYAVEHNADDLGRALYLSLQHRQWTAAARFLEEYLTLPDRDPLLVHYAQGALARVQGRYGQAEREFRVLLARQPGFLPGRLELARVLFEDQQDLEAAELFAAIAGDLDASDPKTEGVRKTVETFRLALDNRRAWNGSFALGPTWSDNVNRTSASHTCLLYLDGTCYFDRKTPDAIVSAGVDYDAGLAKRLPLRGHHGLYLRALLFGQRYRDNSAYNELTASAQAGYGYRSGRHAIALAPSFDYYALGNATLYGAWGMHGEWSYTLSPQSLMKLEGDWKAMRYRDADYARSYDAPTRAAYATYFRNVGPHWTVFGGVDLMDSGAPEDANAYLQKGARLGVSLQSSHVTGSLFASYRRRDYGAFNALLEAQRQDDEQNYILILKTTRWTAAGFVPLLTLRYTRVKSNVDWLYSYDKSAVSLKLERTF
ncbi:surface lipoprotein assembly modifier [Luteimonas sp. R10]|uniref:surface lipoprotein assembly modifier n=1 Tax=Luteimonas sp. R10 TaxID=3108176 RepID=UPI003089622A|nr:surface lipoprotein assembly modifier [Luteimonas sp. R10]